MGIVESTKISLILLGKGILLLEGIMLFNMMIGTKIIKKNKGGGIILCKSVVHLSCTTADDQIDRVKK